MIDALLTGIGVGIGMFVACILCFFMAVLGQTIIDAVRRK